MEFTTTDTKKMSQSAADANAITTQPLLGPANITDMENKGNTPVSPAEAASVITTQATINGPTDEKQEEKKQQRKYHVIETIEDAEDCTWCFFVSADCLRNCECPSCDNCCDDDCADCCNGCCGDGPSADVNVDGDDCAGCLECCTACCEGCSSD